jgi:diguanylate cyclase (GGDEF)-like protein
VKKVRKMAMNLEKDFCGLSHVYVRYYRFEDGKYIREEKFEEWMSDIERDYLEECFPSSSDAEIIDRFVDKSPETLIEGQGVDGSFWYGVALRDDKYSIIGVCIFMGFDETMLSLPEEMYVTDEESLMDSIRFFTLLFEAQNDFESETEVIREELDSVQSESSRKQELLSEKSALSDILMKLESDADFTEISGEILEIAMRQLQFEEVCVLGTDLNGVRIRVLSERVKNDTYRLNDTYTGLDKKILPFYTGRPFTISSNSDMPSEFREFFDTFQIKAGGFFPLFIRDNPELYVQFASFRERSLGQAEIKFMMSVVRVLQAILERRVTMNSLAGSYATLEAIIENAGCGMHVVDVERGEVLYSNEVYKEMTMNPRDKEQLENLLISEEIQVESKTKFHATGTDKWFDISFDKIKWIDGRDARLYTLYDITLLREYQLKIEHQANTDYLTGLKNRKRFELDILSEIRRSERTGQNGALILVGLDDFNNINDSLGHVFGDDLLRRVAEELEKIAAKAASVYRLGGDEFVLMVASGSAREIDTIIHKIRGAFSENGLWATRSVIVQLASAYLISQ